VAYFDACFIALQLVHIRGVFPYCMWCKSAVAHFFLPSVLFQNAMAQMALVLGLETVEELADYWGGDSTITWRLSAAEVSIKNDSPGFFLCIRSSR